MPPPPLPIWTIGYEGVSLPAVLRALSGAGVETLVDVRERASSRRPGFSKTALSQGLAESGIGYWHCRDLGTPKEGRDANKAGRMAEFREIYAQHLASDKGQAGLAALAERMQAERCCLLCLEAEPDRCHRSLVLDAVAPRLSAPLAVTHLLWPPDPVA